MKCETELEHLPEPIRKAVESVLADWSREQQERQRLEIENRLLREELRLLRIQKFGRRSEKLSDEQLALLESEPSVEAAEVEQEAGRSQEEPLRRRKRPEAHPGREPLPSHLPRKERLISSPPEHCRCGCCGKQMPVIGYEQSEELGVEPATYFVWVNKREKRACPDHPEGGVKCAPAPAKIVQKGKLSDEFIIDVLIRKYLWHLPLYRQQAMLHWEGGIDLSRQTLCQAVMTAGQWLEAVSGALRQDLLAGGYIQADETPIGVQSGRTRGRNHRSFMFAYSRPGGPVVFDFRMSRGRDGPREFLRGYEGILQTDGYAGYDQVGTGAVIRMACLAHVRREFYEAHLVARSDRLPLELLRMIEGLYQVEAEAREHQLGHAERLALRQHKSVELMAQLKKRIVAVRSEVLPKSQLGKACNYALGQWDRLEEYLEDGRIEIDNNLVENGIRPFALGRKNWLHIGGETAGPKVAAIASVLETCRRLNIDPRAYLTDVLPKLPAWPIKRVAELTPMAWKAAHQ